MPIVRRDIAHVVLSQGHQGLGISAPLIVRCYLIQRAGICGDGRMTRDRLFEVELTYHGQVWANSAEDIECEILQMIELLSDHLDLMHEDVEELVEG